VLQECEHRRRSLLENEAAAQLGEIARAKLAEIRPGYLELGGSESYWQELEHEILDTAMPRYVAAAVEKTRLERASYDLWRRGDPAARGALALAGLAIGGFIVWAPFIPIWDKGFAFVLAAVFACYPEIKRWFYDFRHYRLLNHLITGAERYQKSRHLESLRRGGIDEALGALGAPARTASPAPALPAASGTDALEAQERPVRGARIAEIDRPLDRP
jgi:hypothetical protein